MRHYEQTRGMLSELLQTIFGKETWFKKDVHPKNKSPQRPEDFDGLMKECLEKVNRPGKNVRILWTLRNYATHICDPEAPFFFENFENAFDEIVITYIDYLKFKKLI